MSAWKEWSKSLPRDDAVELQAAMKVAITVSLGLKQAAEKADLHGHLIALKGDVVRLNDRELTHLWKTACYLNSGRVPNLILPEELDREVA